MRENRKAGPRQTNQPNCEQERNDIRWRLFASGNFVGGQVVELDRIDNGLGTDDIGTYVTAPSIERIIYLHRQQLSTSLRIRGRRVLYDTVIVNTKSNESRSLQPFKHSLNVVASDDHR